VNDITKDKKKQLLDAIIQSSIQDFWVQRPNVAVQMTLSHPAVGDMTTYGFAKVAHPDVWNLDFGVSLAVRKAAAQIVKLAPFVGADLSYLLYDANSWQKE